MIPVNVQDLSPIAIAWAIASLQQLPIRRDPMGFGPSVPQGGYWIWEDGLRGRQQLIGDDYSPAEHWAQGGRIMDEAGIGLDPRTEQTTVRTAVTRDGAHRMSGDTVLIAAMRAYIASIVGEVIQIPEDLTA